MVSMHINGCFRVYIRTGVLCGQNNSFLCTQTGLQEVGVLK
jgi:hypothetical protein